MITGTLVVVAAVDADTVELAALVVVAFVALLMVLERVLRGRRSTADPGTRRREHAVAARKSTTLALGCVGLLVVALLLGRLLLGLMALLGIAVFVTLSVVRTNLARDPRRGPS